jgi:uncharacterized membrane protein
MERSDSIGLWIAYGVICLFLLVLVAVVLRTAMLYASLVVISLVRRGEPRDAARDAGQPGRDA